MSQHALTLRRVYQQLYRCYGPQHWWPGDTPFEIMVGAVLTQNTAWTNVERAIANLKRHEALDAAVIAAADPRRLATWIRPAGYFNVKARRLQAFCEWLIAQDGEAALRELPTEVLRTRLLSVHGVGPETADDILLYAFQRPVFVIDAYTRRIFTRLAMIEGGESYEALRQRFESGLRRARSPTVLFNEYHALIVHHGKNYCRSRPRCGECCLQRVCPSAALD